MDKKRIEDLFYKYYKPEKDKLDDDEAKEYFLQFFFIMFEEKKKTEKMDAFTFYDVISLDEAREMTINALGFVYDLESVRIYNAAVEEFRKLFCTGPRPQPKGNNKNGELGLGAKALAIFLGICEGLDK